MATHNSLFSEDAVDRTERGFRVAVQLPWYRSLWLSAVDGVAVSVNGEAIDSSHLRVTVDGREYTVEELPEQWDTLWFVADPAYVDVDLGRAPDKGEALTIEVVFTMRLLYMQIAPGVDGGPGRYVTNRVPVEREIVFA